MKYVLIKYNDKPLEWWLWSCETIRYDDSESDVVINDSVLLDTNSEAYPKYSKMDSNDNIWGERFEVSLGGRHFSKNDVNIVHYDTMEELIENNLVDLM